MTLWLRAASTATKQMADEVGKNSHEATASLALIGEEIGVNIPRQLRSFITAIPGVSEALNAAFSSVAVVALIGLIVEAGATSDCGYAKRLWLGRRCEGIDAHG